MKAIINMLRSLTETLSKEPSQTEINRNDPLWDLAKTEYGHDPVYAYRCLKRGVNPNV